MIRPAVHRAPGTPPLNRHHNGRPAGPHEEDPARVAERMVMNQLMRQMVAAMRAPQMGDGALLAGDSETFRDMQDAQLADALTAAFAGRRG